MLGVAVLFETAQVLFGMLWALGPVIGGSLVGWLVSDALGGGWFGWAVGWVAGITAGGASVAAIPIFIMLGTMLAYMVSILAWTTFSLWLLLRGVPLISVKRNRRSTIFLFGLLGEMIPFLQLFPLLTLSIYMVIDDIQKEDREYNKKMRNDKINLPQDRFAISRNRAKYMQNNSANENITVTEQAA